MRHGYKNVKFTFGQDARQMLSRKLLQNFIAHGYLTTTKSKAKFLKNSIDRVVGLGKKNTTATRNRLLGILGDGVLVSRFIGDIVPQLTDRTSGFVKSKSLYRRDSDGTTVVKLEWSSTVVAPQKKQITPAQKAEVKDAKAIKVPAKKSVKKQVVK